jgi:ferric-dicitrate binding protein FerR (iron transport regulator)
MKILRSVLRRGSTTQSIGFYSILNANRWFPASRLPDSSEYPSEIAKALASPPRPNALPPGVQEPPFLSEIAEFTARDRRPVRSALILLAAIAIILLALWWILSESPLIPQ